MAAAAAGVLQPEAEAVAVEVVVAAVEEVGRVVSLVGKVPLGHKACIYHTMDYNNLKALPCVDMSERIHKGCSRSLHNKGGK